MVSRLYGIEWNVGSIPIEVTMETFKKFPVVVYCTVTGAALLNGFSTNDPNKVELWNGVIITLNEGDWVNTAAVEDERQFN